MKVAGCPGWGLCGSPALDPERRPLPPSLTVNRLAGVGWRVDYTLSSSLLQSVGEPMVHLRLEVATAPGAPAQPVAMSLSGDKFQVLLAGETQLYLEGDGSPPTPRCCPPMPLFLLQN